MYIYIHVGGCKNEYMYTMSVNRDKERVGVRGMETGRG